MREYNYNSSLDIYGFFHDRKMIGEFIDFMFEKASEFSKMIEDNGNEKPYPINYEARGYQFQIDYNYFIYIVGQWVAKLTGDSAKILKIMEDYSIYSESISNATWGKYRKGFAIFLSEVIEISTTRSKNTTGKYATKIDLFPVFNEKVVGFKNQYFGMKVIGITSTKLDYYSDDFMKNNYKEHKYFCSNGVTQEAFYSKPVAKFWDDLLADNKVLKNNYFMVDKEDFLGSSYALLEKNSFD